MRFLAATLGFLAFCALYVQSVEVESNSTRLVASVGAITENPIPPWAEDSDLCDLVRSCDDCSAERGAPLYCKYSEEGAASCCLASNHPKYANEKLTMTASVGPITENPIPSWASASDVCSAIGSCDACSNDHHNKYCFYKHDGQATCCKPNNHHNNNNNNNDEPEQVAVVSKAQSSLSSPSRLVASVGPIEEDPIPPWASTSDVCSKRRSCDVCGDNSYCKYTETGIPQCCVSANESEKESVSSGADEPSIIVSDPLSLGLVASVGPIIDNPIPSWASQSDVCQAGSCDACQDEAIQYCKFTEEGNQLCCNRQ